MLFFDIETSGLNANVDKITVVACVDSNSGTEHVFLFAEATHNNDSQKYNEMKNAMIGLFDGSNCIAAFNGTCFDLKFISIFFGVEEHRTLNWTLKCVDVFEALRVCVGNYVSLNKVAAMNSIETKISNGRQAIKMAESKQWKSLVEYCIKDVYITKQIYDLDIVKTGGYVVYKTKTLL